MYLLCFLGSDLHGTPQFQPPLRCEPKSTLELAKYAAYASVIMNLHGPSSSTVSIFL
jgi:hypothetical protein